MTKDLTVGNPKSVLIQFSIPLFISVMFQQFYNIADSIIAGKFAGENALAAVGASYPISMIFMAIAVGSNIGCSVIISKFFGAKEYHNVKTAISTTIITAIILSVVMSIAGLLGTRGLMQMIKTPNNIFEDGALYLKIYIAGFLFLFLYNIATGIFTSLGDSKTPLYFLIGSSVGNVVLDSLFVIVFHWGVAGVAWATFIAQSVACILALLTLIKRIKAIKTTGRIQLYSFSMLKKISMIAIPSILQQSFISIGNIFVQRLINSFGSSVIAGYSAAIKLNTFAITSLTTLGNGMSNFTAQNIGAGKQKRIKEGFRAGVLLTLSIASFFAILYLLFAKPLVTLFMDSQSQDALATGVQFLRIVSPFYLAISLKLIADGVLRGATAMKQFMAATFSDLILRVILAYIFVGPFKVTGIWMSWPFGWVVAMVLSLMFYKKLSKGY